MKVEFDTWIDGEKARRAAERRSELSDARRVRAEAAIEAERLRLEALTAAAAGTKKKKGAKKKKGK